MEFLKQAYANVLSVEEDESYELAEQYDTMVDTLVANGFTRDLVIKTPYELVVETYQRLQQ